MSDSYTFEELQEAEPKSYSFEELQEQPASPTITLEPPSPAARIAPMGFISPPSEELASKVIAAPMRAIGSTVAGLGRAARDLMTPTTWLPEGQKPQAPFVLPMGEGEIRPRTPYEMAAAEPLQVGKPLYTPSGTALSPEGNELQRLLSRWSTPESLAVLPASKNPVAAALLFASMVPGLLGQIKDTVSGEGSDDEKRDRVNDLVSLAALVVAHKAAPAIRAGVQDTLREAPMPTGADLPMPRGSPAWRRPAFQLPDQVTEPREAVVEPVAPKPKKPALSQAEAKGAEGEKVAPPVVEQAAPPAAPAVEAATVGKGKEGPSISTDQQEGLLAAMSENIEIADRAARIAANPKLKAALKTALTNAKRKADEAGERFQSAKANTEEAHAAFGDMEEAFLQYDLLKSVDYAVETMGEKEPPKQLPAPTPPAAEKGKMKRKYSGEAYRADKDEFERLVREHAADLGWHDNPELLEPGAEGYAKMFPAMELKKAIAKAFKDLGITADRFTEKLKAQSLPKLKEYLAKHAKLEPVPLEQMPDGSEFTILGEKYTVKSTNPDTGIVTIQDGRTLRVDENAMVKIDPGSLKASKGEPLEFAPAESVEEQKSRLAAEEEARQKKAAQEQLAAKASQPLVGSVGDIGQKDLFGGGDLFSVGNKPTPPLPKEQGMPLKQSIGSAVPAEFEPGQGRPSSIKNAVVDRERVERGLAPMEPVMRRDWGTVWDEAMAKIDRDPGWQDRLIEELRQKPRPITDTENAGLLQRRVDLRNEYDKAARDAAQAYSDGRMEDMEAARMRIAMWSDKLVELEEATGKGGAGTALGRGLNARRMMMNEDFTLAKLELDKRADNGFRPLTEDERAKLQKIADEWKSTSEMLARKLQQREIDLREAHAQLELKRVALEAAQEPKYAPRVLQIAEGFAKKMDAKADTALKRIREIMAEPSAFSGGLNPELLDQLAIYGVAKITRGAVDFAKWSDRMVRDLGEKIQPYLQAAWDKAKPMFDTEAEKLEKEHGAAGKAARRKLSELPREEQIGTITAAIGKKVKAGEINSITPLVQKLARIFVTEGTRDLKTLVKQLHAVILPFASDLTERDVMDAFSGYGKFKLLSKDDIDVTLRDLRGQGQQIAKIEDMNEGRAPMRTGQQRRIPSDVERELIRVVNETKAKGNYTVTNPDTQLRSRLQQWKTTVEHRIADLEKKLANKDYSSRKPLPELKMDSEATAMQAKLEHIRKDWYAARRADQLAKRSLWQKIADRFVRWERAFKLSSPVVFGKLTSAAMTRAVTTLTEEAAGGSISKIPGISRVAAQAPREGGINVQAMAKAAVSAFNKGLNDAAQTARKGAADIDVVYGEKIIDKDWANVFGQLHGMMKAPIKRAEFTLSLEKRMQHAINHGVDVTDPAVQMRLAVEALNDGYRSIFMHRGFASDTFNQLVTMMEKSKRFPVQGELAARAARFLFPIVRVPLNIVSETMTGVHGVATASARTMFHAINGTLDTLPPEVADSIMRQFKKGSIGAGLVAIGYLNAQNIGGYNWREKRKAGAVKAAQFRVGGVDIPRWMTHAPWFELMSFGATIHRTMNQHVGRTQETKGVPEGLWMAGLGLLEETPFMGQMTRVDQMFTPAGRTQYLGELAKSTVIPQAVSWSAAQIDKPVPFHPLQDAQKRKPTNLLQHVEMGIPGLRQNVPFKKQTPATIPTFNQILQQQGR